MEKINVANICSKIEDYFKNKNLFLISSVLVLILILFISFSYASLTPIKTIYITSENLNYEDQEPGAFKITKSSEWIGNSTANIKFDLNSIVSPINKKVDVILAIDTSQSMTGNRLTQIKSEINSLMDYILKLDNENKVGLISFNSEATILSDFTNDYNILESEINALTASEATDYYSALNATEDLLKQYTFQEDKECIILIFTDGANSENIPNEVVKTSYLKKEYPYIKINSIFYEMGDIIDDSMSSVSDNFFKADKDNVRSILYKATVGLEKYDEFVVEDIINSTYFDVIDIKISLGEVSFNEISGNKKITWDLGNNYSSGTKENLEIKIKLKEEYFNTAGVYQTNIQENVNSTLGAKSENVIASLTPIIADNYIVRYEGNDPKDCTVMGIPPSQYHSVFSTVEIPSPNPTCSGYKFKGWKFSDDSKGTKIGDEYFIMPESDVILIAEWAKVKIEKSMEGPVLEVPLLYNIIASKSVADNISSAKVNGSTGIDFTKASSETNGEGIYEMMSTSNDQYPVYYYRGNVDDNNVVFADFCWKAVRTTSTGGVKLLYNGPVDADGGCSASGSNTTIGSKSFNNSDYSLAGAGYMYSEVVNSDSFDFNQWPSYATGDSIYSFDISEVPSWYFSDTVSYCNSNIITCGGISGLNSYSLTNPVQYSSSSNYSQLIGKYTNHGLSQGTKKLPNAGYVFGVTDTKIYCQLVFGGNTWNESDLTIPSYVFAKDVIYDGENYNLIDTISVSLNKWPENYENISQNYSYSCLSSYSVCKDTYFIYGADPKFGHYYKLSNGATAENYIDLMLNSSNDISSTIKTFVDNWYYSKLRGYAELLEDTVWCNDRRVYDYGRWGNNGTPTGNLYFSGYERTQPTLTCNPNDSFTVSSTNGNGRLTYPIGLLTLDEVMLAGHRKSSVASTYLVNGVKWHLMTPVVYDGLSPSFAFLKADGYLNQINEKADYVRPAISLKQGAKVISGVGSKTEPYVVVGGNPITIIGNSDVYTNSSFAMPGQTVNLYSKNQGLAVTSFKLNGTKINGNSFIMPETSAKITDIVTSAQTIFESRDTNGGTTHSNYSNNLNETFEKVYEGAVSLNIELTYQTESSSFDYITLYDSPDSTTPINNKKYGGTTKTTETIVVNSNYIKINFKTDTSINSYYGFKAIIIPNY